MPHIRTDSSFSNALVIDDSKSFLDYFTIVLNSVGINAISTATSGKKALDILDKKKDIELILCDINMPEMDGIEFLRHLADRQFTGEVIVISGEHHRVIESAHQLARAHQLNILGTLSKPVALEQLKTMLIKNEPASNEISQHNKHEFNVQEVRKAIHNDQFLAFFQPKVDIKSLSVVGAEALCRWQHPTLGLVGADAFIPFMEANDLIDEITDLMLDKAILFAHSMSQRQTDFTVSVNISVECLNRLNLPDLLHARTLEAGIRPENLIIEITESRLIIDFKLALEIMARMRLKGFGLSIDDFGTGYSSLEQLQNFPFQELKIDKAFVTGAAHNRASRAIIETSVNLANKLDMKIVAEGAESKEDWDCVAEHGCDIVQGYLVSRPVAPDVFSDWLDKNNGQASLTGAPQTIR